MKNKTKPKTTINFDSDDEDNEPTPQPKIQTQKLVKETPLPKPYKLKIPAQGQRIKGEDQLDWGPRQIKGQDGAWFPLTAKTQQTQEREGKELPAYKEKNEDREKGDN
ncbi:hypothetical protein Tco_0736607 [Tanacetum coccineum]